MDGAIERFVEAVRQRELTKDLGQAACRGSHDPLYDGTCYICGAIV